MRFSFAETMAGVLTAGDGTPHLVSFEVEAEDEGRGWFRLRGLARALPWVDDAPATGSLRLSPWGLRYHVTFVGWTVRGEKTPSLRHPLRSMTTLPVRLTDPAGVVRATGDLRFDLADLPSFAASWVPRPRRLQGAA